jgi:hypothetical protein
MTDPSGLRRAASLAVRVVEEALAGTGVDLVASCSVEAYDARAPEDFRGARWVPGARGVVVAASAGPALWRRFREHALADPSRWDEPHPYDAFVDVILARADRALAEEGIAFRRFDAAFHATTRVDFLALSSLTGLGSPSPFALHVHETHGPWWALRGAWIVDAEVDPPPPHRPPCAGCPAPCVGGRASGGGIEAATAEVRSRCVVGQASRYDDDQIAYHYDRAATMRRLRG